MDVGGEPTTPVIKKPPPTVFPGKNAFLENYSMSDSPEWTRFENPVILMENEILPEELEDKDTTKQLQDEKNLRPADEEYTETRCQNRKPGSEHDQPRRHPLSQVTNMEDTITPLQNRVRGPRAGQHGHGHPCPGAPISFSDDSEEGEESFDSEGGGEEAELQDDTFEFLLK